MIKTQLRTKEELSSIKQWLINTNQSFEYISSGGINFIRNSNYEWKCINSKDNAGHGHHLSRMVKKDINLWLSTNKIKPNKNNYKEQLFNVDNISRAIDDTVVMIDINDCYWTTIFQLGYITESTYKSGLTKKEWKRGRNASIGSLAKTSHVSLYKNGIEQRKKSDTIESPKNYQYIRNHIIGHVYKIFLELKDILGPDFFMFLTDCVVTTVEKRDLVERFLESKGYKFKYKIVEFTSLDIVNKKVCWYDYEAIRRDTNGKEIGKGKRKYYNYADHQLVKNKK